MAETPTPSRASKAWHACVHAPPRQPHACACLRMAPARERVSRAIITESVAMGHSPEFSRCEVRPKRALSSEVDYDQIRIHEHSSDENVLKAYLRHSNFSADQIKTASASNSVVQGGSAA